MRYVEYRPDARLAHVVRCFWAFDAGLESVDSAGATRWETVVPDGHPELIFHCGDRFSAAIGAVDAPSATSVPSALSLQPRYLFAGQLTQPMRLRAEGRAAMLGVRFQPWSAPLLGLAPRETTDRWLGLDDLPYRDLAAIADDVVAARDDAARIALVERALLGCLRRCDWTPDPLAVAFVTRLDHAESAAAPTWTVSERQLERRVVAAVGVSPKRLASILRFRSVFDALQASPRALWLDAAIEAGYFDQAHMIRDFRRFAGTTPRAFMASLGSLSAALLDTPS